MTTKVTYTEFCFCFSFVCFRPFLVCRFSFALVTLSRLEFWFVDLSLFVYLATMLFLFTTGNVSVPSRNPGASTNNGNIKDVGCCGLTHLLFLRRFLGLHAREQRHARYPTRFLSCNPQTGARGLL